MSDTPAEMEAKETIVRDLTLIAQKIWPNAIIEKFGSFATGLSIPNSDIDLVVIAESYDD